MSLNDRLRLASLTKMFTYAAIMELVKRGDLRLTDRAVDLLPDDVLMGVPHSADITVAQLIDHTSGLHNYNGVNGQRFFAALFADSGRSRRWTPRELIAFARDPGHPPTGRPGERRSYSSTGFAVAELIIEQRLRMSYARAMRALIFDPLGMTRTAIEGQDLDGSSIADSYARRSPQDVLSPSPFGERKNLRRDRLVNLSRDLTQYTGWAGAAGAAASNVDDLARFLTAVRSGRFIVLADQEKELAAVRSRPDAFLAWNGGSWGIQTTILYDPGRDIVIIVLGNASNVGVSVPDVARELLTAARGRQSS
jgi:D-alanyl-D-alanine carboxypeptidase